MNVNILAESQVSYTLALIPTHKSCHVSNQPESSYILFKYR